MLSKENSCERYPQKKKAINVIYKRKLLTVSI